MNGDVKRIRIYGDPVLRKQAEKISMFDGKLRQFADRMAETLYIQNGVGLAGPQVGCSQKICVIDLSFGKEVDNILVLVNPEIAEAEGECTIEEGCLSVPEIFEDVERPEKITVRYQSLDGTDHEIEADDYLARVIQHEVDHLNGILFVDKLSAVKRGIIVEYRLKTLAQQGAEE